MSKNTPLLPVEIIEQAVAGEPEAVEAVVQHFFGYIKYLSFFDGHYNDDIQDRLKTKLMEAVSKFRMDV